MKNRIMLAMVVAEIRSMVFANDLEIPDIQQVIISLEQLIVLKRLESGESILKVFGKRY